MSTAGDEMSTDGVAGKPANPPATLRCVGREYLRLCGAVLPNGFDGATAIDRELFNMASNLAFQVSEGHSLPPALISRT
jgi:hypothetical protein